eukprot:CAMPEP_0183532472 /NCGR_PEP_ID=MMETSP0371-20130417/25532_1 /TAXON_ID=268820 /ORGANISM="Peridinium aciculiferum, Strain PAER-2" /LENGTH=69 /DNA_ID=CAMNT_0025732601 /DNA_START=8 /DNA_END=214 /DNA_ORIENTATION=+
MSKMDGRLRALKISGDVAVEELIVARDERDKAERRRLRLQMQRENTIMQKASAKTHVIRMELERGHEED